MLGTRVLSGLLLIAVLLSVLYFDEWLAPWFPLWFLFSVLALSAAAAELVGLLGTAGCGPSLNSVLGGVMAIVVANWVPHLAESLAERTAVSLTNEPVDAIAVFSWPLLTFIGVLMISFLVQSVQFVKPGRTMATIAGTVLVVAYVGLLGSFIIQMRWLEHSRHGMLPLLLLMATAKGADTGAYSLGRLMGRHKLWPSLSPNKTVEGAVGGMVFAVICALLVRLAARSMVPTFTLGWLQTVGYGLLVGLAAQLGDLMESMIKRDCERKDASSAVPGFGGILDVLDSLLFAGPVGYALWITFEP